MSCGANRNALLLHSVGDLFFSADDDTLCQIFEPPTQNAGLQLGSDGRNYEHWFYPDRKKALESVKPTNECCLTLHETMLGKSLGRCISENGSDGFINSEYMPSS